MDPSIKEQLIFMTFFTVILLIIPLILIGLDYWAGIRKAKQRGEKIRSDKMQRTVQKISRYYNCVLALMVLDIVQITGFVFLHVFNGWSLFTFPLLTLIGVGFVAKIEIKSIYEPANAKEEKELKEYKELLLTIHNSLHEHNSPEDIANAIIEKLNKKE